MPDFDQMLTSIHDLHQQANSLHTALPTEIPSLENAEAIHKELMDLMLLLKQQSHSLLEKEKVLSKTIEERVAKERDLLFQQVGKEVDEKDERIKQLQKENKRLQDSNKTLVNNLRDAREKAKSLQDDIEKQNQVQEELSLALSSMKERNERLKHLLENNRKPVEKIVEKVKKVHVMVESPKAAMLDAFAQVDMDKLQQQEIQLALNGSYSFSNYLLLLVRDLISVAQKDADIVALIDHHRHTQFDSLFSAILHSFQKVFELCDKPIFHEVFLEVVLGFVRYCNDASKIKEIQSLSLVFMESLSYIQTTENGKLETILWILILECVPTDVEAINAALNSLHALLQFPDSFFHYDGVATLSRCGIHLNLPFEFVIATLSLFLDLTKTDDGVHQFSDLAEPFIMNAKSFLTHFVQRPLSLNDDERQILCSITMLLYRLTRNEHGRFLMKQHAIGTLLQKWPTTDVEQDITHRTRVALLSFLKE